MRIARLPNRWNRLLLVLAITAMVGFSLSKDSLAGSYFVRTSGNDLNDGKASSRAFRTIGKAAAVALAGDTVYVGAGTYAESVSPTNDGTASAPIRFRADTTGTMTGDAGVVTVTGAGGNGFNLVGDNYISIYGFTIGGVYAIRVEDSTFANIDYCTIQNTTSFGIRVLRSSALVYRSTLKTTGSDSISCETGSFYLVNSLVHASRGRGVHSKQPSSTSMIYYSTIVGSTGSGIRHEGSGTLYVYDSIVALNTGKGMEVSGGTVAHDYNLLYSNTAGDFSGLSKSANELIADPKFTGATDFHLKSLSPALDKGTDIGITDDLDGNVRPNGPKSDLGCYEGVSPSTGSGNEYFVRVTGSDANNGRSAAKALRTINKATSLAVAGEKIYVGAGTYAESITFKKSGTSSSPIELIADSAGTKTGDAGNVIISKNADIFNLDFRSYLRITGFKINPTGDKRAFIIDDCIGSIIKNCEIYGGKNGIEIDDSTLTVENCSIHDFKEDGVEVKDDTNITITNCTIEKCGQDGVELREGNSVVTVTQSILRTNGRCALRTESNKSKSSDLIATRCKLLDCGEDGIRLDVCSGIFENCLITDHNDDGIDISSKGTVVVRHCTIAYNGDDGVVHDRGSTDVRNSIVAFNSHDGFDLDGGSVAHSYNLVYGNGDNNFEKITRAPTEIVANPMFMSATDYHLQSGSPAQDKGTGSMSVALDGTARPIGAAVDIGAYEGTGIAIPPIITKEYYVRISGSDTFNGKTPTTAFRTIAKAISVVIPGDTVWVGAGAYSEDLDFSGKLGTAVAPIHFTADKTGVKTGDAGTIEVRGGLYMQNAAYLNLDGFVVQVTGSKPSWCPIRSGAYVKSSGNITLQNLITSGGEYGLAGSTASDLRVINCTASNATTYGFALLSSSTANLSNCTANSNTSTGYYVDASVVQLSSSKSASNNIRGFHFNASRGNVSNCSSLSDKLAGEFVGVNNDRTTLTVWNFKVEDSRNGGLVLRHCTAQAKGGVAPFSSSGTNGVYAENADITLSDATITSAQYGVQAITASKIDLSNCTITSCQYDGIYPKGGTAILSNCTISSCRSAVKSESNCTLTASNCTFSSNSSWAVNHVGYGSISDCVVNNNYQGIYVNGATTRGDVTISGTKIQGTAREGLMAVRCTGNVIAGTDKLSKAGTYGVYLLDSALTLTGVEIASPQYGVQAYNSDLELDGVTISGCQYDGVYSDNAKTTLSSCTITSCRQGVWGENDSTLVASSSIFSNHSSWGINLAGYGSVDDCQVNTCAKGLYLAGATQKGDITISNTTISGTTGEGIAAINCTGDIVAGSDKLSKGGAYGVYLSNSELTMPSVQISGPQYGVQSFSSTATLSDATISSCSLDGIYGDAATTTLTNCTVTGCRYGIRSENNGLLTATNVTLANNTNWGVHHLGRGTLTSCTSDKNYRGIFLTGNAVMGDITLSDVKIQGTTREGLNATRCTGTIVAGNDKLSKAGDYGAYLSQSNLTIKDVQITGPSYGVMTYSSTLALTGATISDCLTDGLYGSAGTTTLTSCTISRCQNGVNTQGSGTLNIASSTVDACTAWGISHVGLGSITGSTINNCYQGLYLTGVSQPTDITLASTKVQGTSKEGLVATYCNGELVAGTDKFSNGGAYGAYMNMCNLKLTGISISGPQRGVTSLASTLELKDATITGTTAEGVYSEASNATLTNCSITSCATRGIDSALNGTLNATSTTIANCGDWGLAVSGFGNINSCTLNNNKYGANLVGKTTRGDITLTNLTISGSVDQGLVATRCTGTVQGGTDTLSKAGSWGINSNDSQLTLTNATISGPANGIQSTLSNLTIRNVTISNATKGVYSTSDQNLVLDKTRISNCSSWGVHQIQGNSQTTNCLFTNIASGMNLQTTISAKLWNTTVVTTGLYGIYQTAGISEVKNTIVSGSNGTIGIYKTGGSMTMANNLVYGFATNFSGVTPDANSVSKNPRFTNAAGGDYSLAKGSPAINAGTDLAGYVDADLAGSPRPAYKRWEMGAYEYLQESASLRILQWAEKK